MFEPHFQRNRAPVLSLSKETLAPSDAQSGLPLSEWRRMYTEVAAKLVASEMEVASLRAATDNLVSDSLCLMRERDEAKGQVSFLTVAVEAGRDKIRELKEHVKSLQEQLTAAQMRDEARHLLASMPMTQVSAPPAGMKTPVSCKWDDAKGRFVWVDVDVGAEDAVMAIKI